MLGEVLILEVSVVPSSSVAVYCTSLHPTECEIIEEHSADWRVINAKLQASPIHAVSIFVTRFKGAISSKWKISLIAVYEVKPVANKFVLTRHAAASIWVFDTGRDLHPSATQTPHFHLILHADVCGVVIGRHDRVAWLKIQV